MRRYDDTKEHLLQRKALVRLVREKGITDERVLEALFSVPRHFFMHPDQEDVAYEDKAFPIGADQTISQPYTVAYQTQLLDLHPAHKVLEIGTGSAYQAVILAELAGDVYTLERQKALFEHNRQFAYLKMFSNLHLFYGDGYEGLPEFAPFDRILVTAAAPLVPPRLLEQLKPGGRMVLPLGKKHPQIMTRVTRNADNSLAEERFDHFHFVPMLGGIKE